MTAIAYVAKKHGATGGKKVIHLLSTMHHERKYVECGNQSKSMMIQTYNQQKSGCDRFNQQKRSELI